MKSKKAQCRFNRKHFVPAENLYDHEDTCPNRLTNKNVFVCPYNKRHVLPMIQKQLHLGKCPDKKLIKVNPEEEKIKADIQKYIQQEQQNQMNWNDWNSIPDNENTSNSISQSQTQIDNCKNTKQTQVIFSEDDKIFSMVYV